MGSVVTDKAAGPGDPRRAALRVVRGPPTERKKLVPNEVLAVVIFILAEIMFFAGLISAFTISRAGAPMWPPAGQPRLPFETTAINTAALVASGLLTYWAGRQFEKVGPRSARAPLTAALVLGLFFLLFQGYEWTVMLSEGLTIQSSTHGAFFYLIVGLHGLHVLGGFIVLTQQLRDLYRERLATDAFWAARLFWFFVVGLWPLLYWLVYR